MKMMDKLERKFEKYSIRNLMKYIAVGMGIVYVIAIFSPDILGVLGFSLKSIMSGEVWRIITFVFVPDSIGVFAIFYFLILMFFGAIIESYYGSFKLNMYVLVGCLGTILANVILEAIFKIPIPLTNSYLYLSLLLLAATVAPDYEIRIFFVLPVKLKHIAIVYGILTLVSFISASIPVKLLIFFSLMNYLVFALFTLTKKVKATSRRNKYMASIQKKPVTRKKEETKEAKIIQVAFHCCEVCGRTEKDDDELEFRYCSKCAGRHEYCSDHIRNHTHKNIGD